MAPNHNDLSSFYIRTVNALFDRASNSLEITPISIFFRFFILEASSMKPVALFFLLSRVHHVGGTLKSRESYDVVVRRWNMLSCV